MDRILPVWQEAARVRWLETHLPLADHQTIRGLTLVNSEELKKFNLPKTNLVVLVFSTSPLLSPSSLLLTSPSSASGHSSERAIGPRSTGPLQDLYTSPEAGRKDQGHIPAQKKALNLNLYVFFVNYFLFCVPLDRYSSCSGSGLLKLLLILLFLTVPKYSLDKTNCFGIWASGNTVSKTGLLGLTAFACMSTENF